MPPAARIVAANALLTPAPILPAICDPASGQQGLCHRIVDDSTIAGEHAPLGDGDDVAKGCDAALKMHFLYAGTDRRERSPTSGV